MGYVFGTVPSSEDSAVNLQNASIIEHGASLQIIWWEIISNFTKIAVVGMEKRVDRKMFSR